MQKYLIFKLDFIEIILITNTSKGVYPFNCQVALKENNK